MEESNILLISLNIIKSEESMEEEEIPLTILAFTFRKTMPAQQYIMKRTTSAMEGSSNQSYLLDRIGNTTTIFLAGKEIISLKLLMAYTKESTSTLKSSNSMLMQETSNTIRNLIYPMMEIIS